LEEPGVWQTLGKKKNKEKRGGKRGDWSLANSGRKKKKEYIHTHSYTQVVVHISMYDGEEA
jgi:hypothetical protein